MTGILDGFGDAVIGVDPSEFVEKKKAISPFDFANSINFTKENLIVDEWSEKQYNPYIVNKALSYGPDTVIAGNEVNSRPHLDKKMQYDFLLGIVSKRKRYNKWLKPEREEKLAILKEYYGYNNTKAAEALRLLTDEEFAGIEKRLNKGGK
jgi:hypothetical protein